MDRKTNAADKRSRDARVIRSRAALHDALGRLLQRNDVAEVTVQMIVAEAGIGYATFFRHFRSVDRLLIDIAETMTAEFIAMAMPAILADDRSALLSKLADYVAARRATVHALLVGGGDTVRADIVKRAMTQASLLSSRFDPAIPVELAVTHAVTGTIDVLAWWTGPDNYADAATVSALIERLALHPLAA